MKEEVISLDKFVPRDYQIPFIKTFEEGKIKRFIILWARRAGKDLCIFNLIIRAALRRVGSYGYVFPTYGQARRALWDAIDIDGRKVLDYYLPPEIVKDKNEQLMRIRLINGSSIQFIGSENVDTSIVGSNFAGMVFSEWSIQDPRVWQLSVPILRASGGFAVFATTVRGHNHFFDMYNRFIDDEDWFVQNLTVDDTKHIPIEEIEKDIATGVMSREYALAEYWNRFDLGIEGSYFGRAIDDMRNSNRIGQVNWIPHLPVHTAWDLGWNDDTSILFVQIDGSSINVIDQCQTNKEDLRYYVNVIKSKPYTYGKHILPHDGRNHEISNGSTRLQTLYDLGLVAERWEGRPPLIDDKIEAVRRILPLTRIDEKKCEKLIKSLENYRQEYDQANNIYRDKPVHDWSSHAVDALTYFALSMNKIDGRESTAEEIQNRYNQARYGVMGRQIPSQNIYTRF